MRTEIHIRIQGEEELRPMPFTEMSFSTPASDCPMFCCSYIGEENMIYDEERQVVVLSFDEDTKRKLLKMCEYEGYDSILIFSMYEFICNLKEKIPSNLNYRIVEYLSQEDRARWQMRDEYDDSIEPCFIKDKDFEYQKEYRILINNIDIATPHIVKLPCFQKSMILGLEEIFNNTIIFRAKPT